MQRAKSNEYENRGVSLILHIKMVDKVKKGPY